MSMNLTAEDRARFATIRVEFEQNDGTWLAGTASLFAFCPEKGGDSRPALVTTRRLLDGAGGMRFLARTAGPDGGPSGESVLCQVKRVQPTFHPNERVELGAIGIAKILLGAKARGQPLFVCWYTTKNVTSADELTSIEDVLSVGYPIALWDEAQNAPITRRGTTASDPRRKHRGRSEFLVDIQCAPGMEGAPVLLNSPLQTDAGGPDGSVRFLGIMGRASPSDASLSTVIHSRRVKELEALVASMYD